jgi:hypothetical protein
MVREFPDPYSYVIGFTCSSQVNPIKRSTVVVSAMEENKMKESINRDLESSPVQLYSKTFHNANHRGISSSMDSRGDDIEMRFQQTVNGHPSHFNKLGGRNDLHDSWYPPLSTFKTKVNLNDS